MISSRLKHVSLQHLPRDWLGRTYDQFCFQWDGKPRRSIRYVYLATFTANIPVIFVTVRSRHFEDDSVSKLIASLAVSDVVNGLLAACCAGLAWSLQPGQQAPTWLLRVINSGIYICRRHAAGTQFYLHQHERSCRISVGTSPGCRPQNQVFYGRAWLTALLTEL